MTVINTATSCVDHLCTHYNLRTSNTPIDNNIHSIIDTLAELEFYACEIRMEAVQLIACPMPAIIQTITGFMVVMKTNSIGVTVMDPLDGNNHRIAFHDLIKIWTGAVIVIEPPPARSKSFFQRLFGG